MLGATILNTNTGSGPVHQYDYYETIVASQKVNWRVEDIIGGDKQLDFFATLYARSPCKSRRPFVLE